VKRHAPATARNRDPILAVLREVLPAHARVLEIASGSGEHAVHFAQHLPGVTWQPSDPEAGARASIDAYRAEAALPNLLPPIALDAASTAWSDAAPPSDAIVCINMIHIAPWEACEGLVRGAARLLPPGGVLFLYGPYRFSGSFTAPSNAEFDASLRARDPRWGVRDLDDVTALAARHGFARDRVVAMPANNHSVVFTRQADASR
jgi:cyclopropane fatty-acyl-phospholipid synthase-like methyltransferase